MSKLWGGRFSKKTNKLVEEFTNSIHFDHKLAKYDVLGSLYHIDVLKKAGLLNAAEHKKLKTGLEKILNNIKRGAFKPDLSFEDIHSYIQYLLEKDKSVGPAALKLHTCRSRNDQVVIDTKMYCLDQLAATEMLIQNLKGSLNALAMKNKNIYVPGFTHLQHAIPVSLADYFDAYVQMLARDQQRLLNAQSLIDLSMGSGALAGTMIDASKYVIPAKSYLSEMNFGVSAPANSLDTVSDRDFLIETLNALAITGMHLSRLAEDMILWASKEFDFIDIDDAFCTGSSLMPQKKNPDVLELVRGYAGRLYGNLIAVLTLMKGLPMSYNRDMQLDKEPLFDSFEIVHKELRVLAELFKNIKFKKESIEKQLDDESLYATDLSDYLVQNGVAFKTAHGIIGGLIQHKYKTKSQIRYMDVATLKKFHPLLTPTIVRKIINPEQSVKSKKSVKRK